MIQECSVIAEALGVSALLPDCNMITNATGTPLPAFPPDGTQCTTGPADPSTHPTHYNATNQFGFHCNQLIAFM
jgi:hypothetical protein